MLFIINFTYAPESDFHSRGVNIGTNLVPKKLSAI